MLGSWEERSDAQRELDMRIGAAAAAAERERITRLADESGALYPDPDAAGLTMPFADLIRELT